MLNGNAWPDVFLLDWRPAIFKLQLWRLLTPFLYLGPVGMNFLLNVHFSWTYMSQLEKLHYREPHTFVMLLLFGISRCGRAAGRAAGVSYVEESEVRVVAGRKMRIVVPSAMLLLSILLQHGT